MLHAMLQYSEVFADLSFIPVPSLPLELCHGTNRRKKTEVKDGANIGITSNMVHQRLALESWHQHINAEKLRLQGCWVAAENKVWRKSTSSCCMLDSRIKQWSFC
eukprot:14938268-Ditylum_brightwellii.AAC.1